VFAQECSACHSLVGNESQHKLAGDLAGVPFSRTVLLQFASEMPAPRRLSAAQLRAVVEFVGVRNTAAPADVEPPAWGSVMWVAAYGAPGLPGDAQDHERVARPISGSPIRSPSATTIAEAITASETYASARA